jgi:hypothetical protein
VVDKDKDVHYNRHNINKQQSENKMNKPNINTRTPMDVSIIKVAGKYELRSVLRSGMLIATAPTHAQALELASKLFDVA